MQPKNRKRGESLMLSRSEIARLADALAPIIAQYPRRDLAAKAIGISDGTIAKLTRRLGALSISRTVVDDVGRAVGIDVSGFGA